VTVGEKNFLRLVKFGGDASTTDWKVTHVFSPKDPNRSLILGHGTIGGAKSLFWIVTDDKGRTKYLTIPVLISHLKFDSAWLLKFGSAYEPVDHFNFDFKFLYIALKRVGGGGLPLILHNDGTSDYDLPN
jgi:hypothetical protein